MPETLQPPRPKPQALELGAGALLLVVFLAVSLWRQRPFTNPAEGVGIVLGAGLTLIMYSFLYRDNALFKIAENLYVGVSLGWTAILTWRQVLRPEVYEPMFLSPTPQVFFNELLHRFVPILLGILLLTRLSSKYSWLSRYSYATMIGWGAGVAIPITTNTFLFQQLHAAIAPFQETIGKGPADAFFTGPWFLHTAFPILNAVVLMVGTVAVLWYFFFSVEHKRAGGIFSKIGIWFLMVSFGASFGYTVMGRVSLLIGRVQFLLFDWLRLPK